MLHHLTTWFANPALLGFLAVLPLLAILQWQARRRRRQACDLLGQTDALQKLQRSSPIIRSLRTASLFLGLALLIVGAAGPRWGRIPSPAAQRPEGDLVLVMDLSRSMLAEQPSRQELARRALRNLATTLADHGGPRLALVIFAAHPQLAFPLTGDYDHLNDVLGHMDADDLPPSLRPQGNDGLGSGTRIGAALRLALTALDPKTGGDILLLSDGDDPAGDDEWLQGAEEARRHHVRVHTIGIGNPGEDSTIPWGNGILEFGGQPVLTRLQEKPLQDIARRTGGNYVPAYNSNLPLGKLLPSILAHRAGPSTYASETGQDSEESLPIWQPRYDWFLALALCFLVLALLGSERRSPFQAAPARLFFLPFLISLASAAPLPGVDSLLRQGIEAFKLGHDQEALRFFEDAEEFAPDPALVAFNKAAALYRLERFGEAALHYQRCLEDRDIPAGRRSRAFFQMGNAYLQDSQGTNRALLENALAAYRACLLMEETAEDVRADARHNVELARLLWLKTVPNPEDPPRDDDQEPPSKVTSAQDPETKKDPSLKGKNASKADEPGTKDSADAGQGNPPHKPKKAISGPITVLPDRSELVPLSPQETEAFLEDITQRILTERRHYRRQALTVPANVKDW